MSMSVKQGDSLYIPGTRLDLAGAVVPLTGATIACQLRAGADLHTLTCEIDDAEAGTFILSATPAQTATWPAKTYTYDVEFTGANGDVQSTATGVFVVEPDVTNSD